jgi:hypothetical protein
MDSFQRVKLSNNCYSEWARVSAWIIRQTIRPVSRNSNSSHVQRGVNTVVNWSLQNRLQLKGDKCKELVIDFKRQKYHHDRTRKENQLR